MKLFIQIADANLRENGPVKHLLLDWLPDRVHSIAKCDAVVVPVAWHPDYKFNEDLLLLKRPVVLIDYLEFGWNFGPRENRIGKGTTDWPGHLNSPEWAKLDAWVRDHPPALVFKRELFKRDVGERFLPIDFPCCNPPPKIPSRAEFDARPFDVFYCWGLSHPDRARLQGDIFHAMANRGLSVISDWIQFKQLPEMPGRTWVAIHSPYWARVPMERVMEVQHRSKVSISMPGAGQKCFRSSESACGAIMAMPKNYLAWSYDWHDGNSILLTPGQELESLLHQMEHHNLYDIYLSSQINFELYRCENYARDYVMPAIERLL